MSVVAGRVLIIASALALVVGAIWVAAGFHAAGWTFRSLPAGNLFGETMGFAGALAVVGGVFLLVSVPIVGPYVEADVRPSGVVLRRVLGRRLTIPATAIDEVILLTNLRMPARFGSIATPRVILRGEGRTLTSYTPRTQVGVAQQLEPLGIEPTVVPDALWPGAAHRRFPGSVSIMERSVRPMSLGAVVVAALVLVWVLGEAL